MQTEGIMARDNSSAVDGLFQRLVSDFGESSGQAIIKTIVSEVGGLRVCIPDFNDLYRADRDRKIRDLFNGANHRELAIMFSISESSVRRILK